MSNNQYIYVFEESTNDDGIRKITPNLTDMKFLEKLVLRSITSKIDEMKEANKRDLEALKQENLRLQNGISSLLKTVNELSLQLSKNNEKTNKLLERYNMEKASIDSKYKEAIDFLYRLNIKFEGNVGLFGRAKKLDTLQMLVYYLYKPDNSIRERIQQVSMGDEKTMTILSEIDKFNSECKSDLLEHLTSINCKWDDCVHYPKGTDYDPKTMACFNDIDIEVGTPIYVVSLGFDFPNSNSEKQLPKVFKRVIS